MHHIESFCWSWTDLCLCHSVIVHYNSGSGHLSSGFGSYSCTSTAYCLHLNSNFLTQFLDMKPKWKIMPQHSDMVLGKVLLDSCFLLTLFQSHPSLLAVNCPDIKLLGYCKRYSRQWRVTRHIVRSIYTDHCYHIVYM